MAHHMKRLPMQLLLVVLLFVSFVVVTDRYTRSLRVDLTADRLYTLSEGTTGLLSGLDKQVTLEFYFSRSLAAPYPQILEYGKRVEDMLRSLAAVSDGSVTLSTIDPEAFSEQEDDAVEAGLKGAPLGDGSMLYLGLKITDELDGEAAIPFFSEDRETFLEYDVVKAIATLDEEGKKQLTLLTSLPMQFGPGGPQAMMQGQAQPYVIYQQLGEFFNIQELNGDFAEIPVETDVLMLVHPPELSDDQLYLIDQYVLAGGKAVIFLDPHSEATNPRATSVSASSLGALLPAWGVDMPAGKIVGDASLAQRVQMGGYGPDSVKDYVFWLALRDDFMADGDIVTGSVETLSFATSGVITPVEGASTSFEPLVTTSKAAMLFDASRAVGEPDPDALLRDLEPTGESYALAGRLTGGAATAFPDRDGMKVGNINVVLGADSDLFEDRFWVQLQELLGQRIVVPFNGNGSFILNLADHISGSDALLDLRGRGISKRPFDVVDTIRREAEAKYLQEEELLQNQLQATERRIAELEAQKPDGTAVLSVEQENEIEEFRAQLLETRKELRAVNRNLRREIDSLGGLLAFINIALVPILIVLFALARLLMRRRAKA
jgi:ABC-type uncharacterized transport system involved in gliding motility auxiliary subunit